MAEVGETLRESNPRTFSERLPGLRRGGSEGHASKAKGHEVTGRLSHTRRGKNIRGLAGSQDKVGGASDVTLKEMYFILGYWGAIDGL